MSCSALRTTPGKNSTSSGQAPSRVDRPEEPARDRREPLGFTEPGLRREPRPGAKREREGDPWVAVVGVVLHEDEATTRAKVAPDETEDGDLLAVEMERVRHDDSIERRQLERFREIADERHHADPRERVTERPELNLKGAGIPIDRVDRAGQTEQVGEGQGKGSFPGPKIGPGRPAALHAIPEQPDMVAMVHGDKSGPRVSPPRVFEARRPYDCCRSTWSARS